MAGFSSLLAFGLAAGGAATSAYGQVRRGREEEKAARAQGDAEVRAAEAAARASESQAELAEYNAAIADIQARDTEVTGDQAAQRFRSRTKGLIGEQRAGIAAGNIDVGYGSAVDVQADAALLGELDALTVRTNAAREAWGFRVEAEDSRTRAGILKDEATETRKTGKFNQQAAYESGKAARSAGKWGAASTLIGAGTSLLESRYGFGRR